MTRMKNRLKSNAQQNQSNDSNNETTALNSKDKNNTADAAAGTNNPNMFPDTNVDFITISDDEDESTEVRQPISFMPNVDFANDDYPTHK